MISRIAALLSIVFAVALAAGQSFAAGPDIAAGRAIAEASCARCHAVGVSGESPTRAAPPFRTFARMWPVESLEEALAEGIMVGHPEMPDFAPLSDDQVGDFIGYLKSIQRP